jgi:hypothetical protein
MKIHGVRKGNIKSFMPCNIEFYMQREFCLVNWFKGGVVYLKRNQSDIFRSL